MRKILFRGQRKIDRQWVYGLYTQAGRYFFIETLRREILKPDFKVVYGETVGQYVGIEDSTGNRIFEGDILKNVFGEYGIVECSDNFFYIRKALTNDYSPECFSGSKVVGNIYDNPELVREKRLDWRK